MERALEIGALAFACRLMERPAAPVAPTIPPAASVEPHASVSALDFVSEGGGSPRIYRAFDREGEMLVAFFRDGRMRLADDRYRFAGMVQNAHAHLLDVSSENWSEAFVRVAPSGTLQLELRDGPYDARILTCEPLS